MAGRQAPLVRRLQWLTVALVLSLVVVGRATYHALDGLGEYPPTWLALTLTALVVVSLVQAETLGFRPLPARGRRQTAQDPGTEALDAYQRSMMLRWALTSAPTIIALAVCFVRDEGAWPYVITAVLALPIMAFETWPSRRNIDKFARALEAHGQPSGLRERLLGPG